MKKEYISPVSSISEMSLSALLAGSLNSSATGVQTVIPDYKEPSPSEFTSRRYQDVWADDVIDGEEF